jgi:hypothetical protein
MDPDRCQEACMAPMMESVGDLSPHVSTLDLHESVRRRVHGIDTFNVLRGGEYVFMPSLSALRWIGRLADTHAIA